jgi:hypothetical protein
MGRMKELMIMTQDIAYDQYMIDQCEHQVDDHHAEESHINTNVVHVNFATKQQVLPNFSSVNTKKMHHSALILSDVCSQCAHCGLALTDAVSVERGMGGRCSSKGYMEDPVDGDELQAMIDLAEYPELVELLTKNYKPLGVRGLMNGLVKVASLNRKHEVFGACCDAIDSLGYKRLASLLRQSLAAVSVTENKNYPDYYAVWVKKLHFKYQWVREMREIPGTRTKVLDVRGILVPKTQKVPLWDALNRVYDGYIVKTEKGAFKIKRGKSQAVKA